MRNQNGCSIRKHYLCLPAMDKFLGRHVTLNVFYIHHMCVQVQMGSLYGPESFVYRVYSISCYRLFFYYYSVWCHAVSVSVMRFDTGCVGRI